MARRFRGVFRPTELWMLAVLGCIAAGTALAESFDGTWTDPRFKKEWRLTESREEVLVVYEPAATDLDRELLAGAYDLEPHRPFDRATRTEVFRLRPEGRFRDAGSLVSALLGEVVVRSAVPAVIDQEGFTKYYVPGEVTVQFRRDLSHEACVTRVRQAGSFVLQDHWTPGYYTISVPEGESVFAAVRAWAADANVVFSEPSYMLYDDELHTPNDPLFGQQWHLNNTGQTGGVVGADVDAQLAWDICKGDPNVIVAVIDTGMDLNHEDLRGNLLERNGEDWDFASADGSPDDEGDHGTACSGIAVAVQDNGIGVSGIAPLCRVMPLRVSLQSGQNQNRADAINYAASRRADFTGLVMSCSWRMSAGDFTAVQNAIVHADSMDCVMVFASGNDNGAVNYPARYPETIACGASSPCDERKSYTSCDGESFWGSNYGPELDVISPGVIITTTDRTGNAGYGTGNYVNNFNGTSSATPLAAGICALIWSANPSLTAHEVRAILEQTAEDQVGPQNEDAPGWDPYFGWGRVNAFRAVQQAAVVTDFEDDMESGAGGWTHQALSGLDPWHLSQRRNHTPDGLTSYHCGDSLGGDYSMRTSAALTSPAIRLQPDSWLSFYHWIDAYAPNDTTAGDGARIELSTDNGVTWTRVDPVVGGYDHVWRSFYPIFPTGSPVWSGHADWRQVVCDLSAYEGNVVKFRFRFGARGQEPTGEGWYIDDVDLLYMDPAGVTQSIDIGRLLRVEHASPNPFSRQAAIRYSVSPGASASVEILDLAGRCVMRRDLGFVPEGTHEVLWDGTDGRGATVPEGIYFYRIRAGEEAVSGRLALLR